MILTKQYRCIHSASCVCTKGHLSEEVIFLVFNHLNWNPKLIVALSCACKWFDDLAKRVLWKEFCKTRAPKMMLDLQSSGSHIVDGNWSALGKLLIYCSGCDKNGLFKNIHIPGHFVHRTRFSRTSGKSFLLPQCRTDVLYVSDPCEHLDQGDEGDIGFFRGIFKSFATSKVRKILINRKPHCIQQRCAPTVRQNYGTCWRQRCCHQVLAAGWVLMKIVSSIMCALTGMYSVFVPCCHYLIQMKPQRSDSLPYISVTLPFSCEVCLFGKCYTYN